MMSPEVKNDLNLACAHVYRALRAFQGKPLDEKESKYKALLETAKRALDDARML